MLLYLYISNVHYLTHNTCLLTASSFGIGILVCFCIDFSFYGVPTCTPWNFFYVNIVQNVAERYGTSPWHWLFSNAVPTMLGSYTIQNKYSSANYCKCYKSQGSIYLFSSSLCSLVSQKSCLLLCFAV